jgi:ABC-2 type transport system ATP-binding protein
MMPNDPVLEVENLSKRFGNREAVRSISFAVRHGEVFGFLGPNGAGKSTTVGMIAGVLRPSGGAVRILGQEVGKDGRAVLHRLGLVPQTITLYPSLTAEENLSFFGRIYGLSGESLSSRVTALLDLAGLEQRRCDRVVSFSGGMKRRLNLVCALVHQPALILLDEPTVGVDPQSRERIYDAIEALAAGGYALLLTTHYMEEAERLCQRLAIMDEGQIVATGTVEELRAMAGKEPAVEIQLERAPGAMLMKKLAACGVVSEDRRGFRIHVAGVEKFLPDILSLVASEGNVVAELGVHRPNLGDAFLHLTGKALRD